MRHILAILMLGLAALPVWAGPYSGIYFFGDSLTDTGNVSEVYALAPKPPGAPAQIPGAPYDPQGRASNGLIYADVLAAGLGLDATAYTRGGDNYAFGGARTRYQVFGPPFLGIIDQVLTFTAQPGMAQGDELFVLWAGSNNLQDLLLGRAADVLGNPIPGVAQTLGDLNGMLTALYAEGARHLLVPNVANLVRTPRLNTLSPAQQAAAVGLIQAYNSQLEVLLAAFEGLHPDADIIRFDAFNAFEDLIADAAALGFTNTTDRCYTGDDLTFTGGGSVCANPDTYFFWDGIHPTAAAHRFLGQQMLAAVVPEPGSLWLVLTAALAAAGLTRRFAASRV